MLFWVRNIIFGGVLAALAYFFFANQDLLSSFGDGNKTNSTAPAPKVDTTAISTPVVEKKAPKKEEPKEENQAAKSLSKFYAKINGDPNVEVPTIRNNIVYLPAPSGDLETLLNARKKIVRAYPQNWKGTVKSYPFRLGETIGGKLSDFAEQDKLKVFWRLNRDYVVKDAFRINKNILKAALQLGQGIDGHFQNGVSIYFCYASRSIVVIEGTKSYLNERCSLLKSNSGY